MSPVVEVRGLRKSYGAVDAVRGIDFDVHEGEIFALLGPNGAGKTTTVEILEGYRGRDAGSVRVLDFDPASGRRAYRDRIGIVLQSAGIELQLTVGEALFRYGSYYTRPRDAAELAELVGLTEKFDARIASLSGGQRRRLDLALALVGHPDIVFLDEPTTGFDPEARRRAWDLIESLRRFGTTILLTSHYMDEVERLADRVAVVARGEMVAMGVPAELGHAPRRVHIAFRMPDGIDRSALPPVGSRDVRITDGTAAIETDTPTAVLHALTEWAMARGVELADLTVRRPSLEDLYLELTDLGADDT
jgi:ABC-2 type transport system ATP-binding protein